MEEEEESPEPPFWIRGRYNLFKVILASNAKKLNQAAVIKLIAIPYKHRRNVSLAKSTHSRSRERHFIISHHPGKRARARMKGGSERGGAYAQALIAIIFHKLGGLRRGIELEGFLSARHATPDKALLGARLAIFHAMMKKKKQKKTRVCIGGGA